VKNRLLIKVLEDICSLIQFTLSECTLMPVLRGMLIFAEYIPDVIIQ
jgi:hypothetical protein